MGVTGYLSLYTTMLGWQVYNSLWAIMMDTGLVFLPFIALFLQATIPAFLSMGAKDAALISLRRLLVMTSSSLVVFVIAGIPSVTLESRVLHFQPACVDNATAASPGDTGTTYDNAFDVPTDVKVPILWYLIMQFANGFTDAASQSLDCAPIQYRALHNQLDMSHIHDPQLQQEVGQFYNQCYVPAYATYLDTATWSESQQNQIHNTLQHYGQQDVGWLGSQTFLTVDGFYNQHSANTPVQGFPFDASRDIEEGQTDNHSPWGMPDCVSWWNDANHGLYQQLLDALPVTVMDEIKNMTTNQDVIKQAAVKALIQNTSKQQGGLKGYESLTDNQSGHWFSRIGAYLGISLEKLTFYPKNQLLINSLPIIQAILLFAVYSLLAILLPFSKYSIKFCTTASFFLFALTLCRFLWQLVMWLDNSLVQSIYGTTGTANSWETWFNLIISLLYIGLPLLLLSMGAWAGIAVGNSLEGLMGKMDGQSTQTGGTAGNAIKGKFL